MNSRWRELLWPEAAVWLALVVLLGTTLAAAFIPMRYGTAANLGIAAVKAILVAAFFMHLRRASGLDRLASILGPFWLALLIGLVVADLLAR